MQINVLEGAEAKAASAAMKVRLKQCKAELRAAGARSFEGAYIDAEGVARSIDLEVDAHD